MDSQLQIAKAIEKLAEAIEKQTEMINSHNMKLHNYWLDHLVLEKQRGHRDDEHLDLRKKEYIMRIIQAEANTRINELMEALKKK